MSFEEIILIMKKYCWSILFFAILFAGNSFADDNPEPPRRAKPAPLDSIFPSSEYLGPTIGVPDTDPVYPLTKFLWNDFSFLKRNDIRIYGWVNPSVNLSTSHNSNAPLSYDIVPNRLELD